MDIPRIFTVSESEHRIHNPFTPEKYATLGRALRMAPGTTILDLGSGSGEMLCSWARDHQIVGTGVDMSLLFSQQAAARAATLPGSLFQRLSACARTLFKPVVLIRYGWPFTDLISFLVLSFLKTARVQSLSNSPSRV